jgi:hypothetical protein
MSAALLALYARDSICPFFPASEATLTIAPRAPESIIDRATSLEVS